MTPVSYSRKRKRISQSQTHSQHISTASIVHTVGTSHISGHSNESVPTQHTTRSLIDRTLSKEEIEQLKNRIQSGSLDITEILQTHYDLLRNNVNKSSRRALFSKMKIAISCSKTIDNATKNAYTEAIEQSCAESSFIELEHKIPSQKASLILRQIYDRTLPLNCVEESFNVLKQECSKKTALQHMKHLMSNLVYNTKSNVEREQIKSCFDFTNVTHTTQIASLISTRSMLKDKLLSCNFTPETGIQIIQQLLDTGTSINTIRSIITRTRQQLKLKGPSPVYAAMSDALYISTKRQLTLDKIQIKSIKQSLRQGTILKENIATSIQQLINAKENPCYICDMISTCKSKIRSSDIPTKEKYELIKELELSYQTTKKTLLQPIPKSLSSDTNEVTNIPLEVIDTEETSHTLQDAFAITNAETSHTTKEVQTQHSQIIDMEQVPQISDDILDLFDISEDLQIIEAHELTFLQDTDLSTSNFEKPDTSNNIHPSQTHKTIHIEQKELTSSQTPAIEEINLQHIENGQIDPNILMQSVIILLKTTLPETLMSALSLYEINHTYNPEDVSALLSSAAQLIRSHQSHKPDSQSTSTNSTLYADSISHTAEQQPATKSLINRILTKEELDILKNKIASASLDITEILQARYDLIKNNVPPVSIRAFFNKMKTSIACSSTMDDATKLAYIETIIQTGAESSFIESEHKVPSAKASLIIRQMYECTLPLNRIKECLQTLKLECSDNTATKLIIAMKKKIISKATSSAEQQQINEHFLFLASKLSPKRRKDRTSLKKKLLSCNFTPETGPQIIKQLLDMDTPVTTVKHVIAKTRAHLKKTHTGQLYKAMFDSLYLSKKQYLTPKQLQSDCKSKIQLPPKKDTIIKKIEMLSETTKMDSRTSPYYLSSGTDENLDLSSISDDLQLLETHELTFLQDTDLSATNFEQPESSKIIRSPQTNTAMNIETNRPISSQTALIEGIKLQHIENGQIDPNLLVQSVIILLKTTLPETLMRALSLYEINHLYNPEDVSAILSSAAQLIRSHQAHKPDSQSTSTNSTLYSDSISHTTEQQPETKSLINRTLTKEELEILKDKIASASLDITEILQARYDLIKNNVSSISTRALFNKMKISIACSSTINDATKKAYIEEIVQTSTESLFIESENKAPSAKASLLLRQIYECTLPLNRIEECFQLLKLECSHRTAIQQMIALKNTLISNATSSTEKQQLRKHFLFLSSKPTVPRTSNRIYLKNQLLSCNFTPETGQQIIKQLIDMGTPITTIRRIISDTRGYLKKKFTNKLYKEMSDSLYLSKKQHLTPEQLNFDKVKRSLDTGDIQPLETNKLTVLQDTDLIN